jgi:integrase
MARTARSGFLETRSARLRLKPQGKPYWCRTGRDGVHLGYRRRKPRGADTNGTWLVRRYTGEGYEVEAFGEADDYSEADGASVLTYQAAMAKVGAELSDVQRQARYTVNDAVTDYITWATLNRKHPRDSEVKLKAYLVKYFDGRLVQDLKPADFQKWLAWANTYKPPGRRKAKVKAKTGTKAAPVIDPAEAKRKRQATLNRIINCAKACLNHAYRHSGRVASDDAWRRLQRFKGADSARLQWLSNAQSQRLINACQPDFRKIVQAALLTGARWSELRALRVRDYDPRSGTIHITTSKADKPRRIPLTEEGQAVFESWTAGRPDAEVLLTRADGAAWGEQDQKRPMDAACKAAKILPAVGFHSLRHSYASALVQAGVPLAIIAEALGHADTRMVSKHYGHLSPSHVADAIRAHLPSLGIKVDSTVQRLRK